jgi:hypothetical protein
MCADIFTKHFTNLPKWQQVLANIAHVDVARTWKEAAGKPAPREDAKASAGKLASPASIPIDRTIVEFCCSPNSMLGEPSSSTKGCEVVSSAHRGR